MIILMNAFYATSKEIITFKRKSITQKLKKSLSNNKCTQCAEATLVNNARFWRSI